MQRSETIGKLAPAFCKAQGAFGFAIKDKTNPAYKSKYADLGAVWEAALPALQMHGLSVIQLPVVDESGYAALETILLHESGEFISSTTRARIVKDDPQGYGSAITFLRRYSLAATLGITQEDDDGQAASQARHQPQLPAQAPARPAQRAQALSSPKIATVTGKAPVNVDALAAWKVKLGKIGKRLGELGAHDEAAEIMAAWPKWKTDIDHAEGAYQGMLALGNGLPPQKTSESQPVESETVAELLITDGQRRALMGQLGRLKLPNTTEARSAFYGWLVGTADGTRTNDLDTGTAQGLIDTLSAMDPAEIEATAAEFRKEAQL